MNLEEREFDMLGTAEYFYDTISSGRSQTADFVSAYSTPTLGRSVSSVMAAALALTPGISDTGLGKFSQSQLGVVRNPHLNAIFTGVRLKSYNFTWKLAPKSEEEGRELESIITYIKAAMHPQIILGGFALEYPFIAELEFQMGEASMTSTLPHVKNSFITRLDVNSSSSGTPAFFKDGKPVTVEIGMGFQEINIQTRDDFLKSPVAFGFASRAARG
jgi:hypothetical protein